MPILLERVNLSVAALQVMTEELAKTGKPVSGLVEETKPDLQEFSRNTLAETSLLVTELRQLTGTLNRVARELEREPNALVLGRFAPTEGARRMTSTNSCRVHPQN
jgi:phospholipid/cholesterol/gamma-HCH transport system substrate-binding protein